MKAKLILIVLVLCLSISINAFATQNTIQPTSTPIDGSTVSSQTDSVLSDSGTIQGGAKKARPSNPIYKLRLSKKLSPIEDSSNTINRAATWQPLSGIFGG